MNSLWFLHTFLSSGLRTRKSRLLRERRQIEIPSDIGRNDLPDAAKQPHCTMSHQGMEDGEAIKAYVLNGVVPELPPGTFVNCHNLATHYNKAAAAVLREVRYWFLDLQTYYPDLNPTEIAFSKLKAHPGSNAARTFDRIFNALAESCNLFTSDECWDIFNEARYGSD